ncbi:MAG: M23 family metallopeptidase [Clostridia bacterium]
MDKHDRAEKLSAIKLKAIRLMREKGIYLVLIACLALVGVSAFFALMPQKQEDKLPAKDVSQSEDERLNQVIRPSATPTSITTPTPIPDFTQAPAKPSPTPESSVAPVQGEIIWRFAANELIYSATLDQWMTHRGADVAAKKGDEVYAAYAGNVESIFKDDALGVCVLLSHSGERKTLYGNLKEKPPIKEGQSIAARTVIGYIGDTAVSECAQKSHLHFELYVKGVAVDPAKYFTFQSSQK